MRTHRWSLILILLLALAFVVTPAASVQSSCVEGLTDEDILANDNSTFCEVTTSALCFVRTPLLSPWTAGLLAAILAITGFVILRRRTRVTNALFSVILLFTVLVTSFYITAWTVQAHDIITSEGHVIDHYHRGERELTPLEKTCINGMVSLAYPAATRTGEPTVKFNAHGYAFDQSRSWILPDQIPTLLADDYVPVTAAKQVGDIIVYDNSGEKIGSGIVRSVDGSGNVLQVESKWGIAGTYLHAPNYGPHYNLSTGIEYYRHE